jgi:hypothetical protein
MTRNNLKNRVRQSLRLAGVLAVAVSASGCSMTTTTTSVRATPGPVTQRLRLSRAGLAPLEAHFAQQETALVGRVSFAQNCVYEGASTLRRELLTTTTTNKQSTTALLVAGGILAAAGVALYASSSGKDENVYCGDGEPEDGDQCHSEAGAYRYVGVVTLGTGLGALLGGGALLARKPKVETKPLESQELHSVGPTVGMCGKQASLDGLSVYVNMPGGGTWSGRVDAEGSARIDLPSHFEATTLPVFVGAVPASAAGMVSPGMHLTEVTLQTVAPPARPSKKRIPAAAIKTGDN